jgi:Kef-type K+ transport system membrane component KefB
MTGGIFEIAVIVILAAALGLAARFLKQPPILAYIFTGILVSVFGVLNIKDNNLFAVFSELGIMLLLFLIGLEINYTSLKIVGRVSLIIGLGQIAFTSFFGFLIAKLFGFSLIPALYIAVALTFSSTVIIVKLLSEKKALSSLYGKISIGFLLIQDFVAILILLFLNSLKDFSGGIGNEVGFLILKGIFLLGFMVWIGREILPYIFRRIAKSNELLFISSLAWCFFVAFLVKEAGFSIEIGGFMAGLALANSAEHFQISSNLRSLRDFFILIFFAILGASFVFADLSALGWPIIVFSLFVLIGNPLIVVLLMGILGYRKRTSFLCGVTVAQISEFSLILAAFGFKIGHIDQAIVSLIAGVGIVTITLSTYLIVYAERVMKFVMPVLNLFERKKTTEKEMSGDEEKPIILIGFHRTGESVARHLPASDLLVVDFDPDVIKKLKQKGISYIFGDVADAEIFDHLNLLAARVLISTTPEIKDSLTILERLKKVKEKNPALKIIVTGSDHTDAEILYRHGADYVLLPNITSGKLLGRIISNDPTLSMLAELKNQDLN